MKARSLLFIVLIAVTIWGCKKGGGGTNTNTSTNNDAALIVVKIEAKNNTGKVAADVNCTIAGDSITAIVPDMLISKKLALTFTPRNVGTTAKVGDTTQISGSTVTDFSTIVNYVLTTPNGSTKTYKVIIRVFTGLLNQKMFT
jgi:hypothetical protein